MNHKKANDMVPYSGIIECLRMYKISNKLIKFTTEAMKNWRVVLTAGGKTFQVVKILRGIFLRDALSP